jgi:hypothetical protein
MGVFEGCLVVEEMAYGCSGIATSIQSSNLGVSTAMFIHTSGSSVTCSCLGLITTTFIQSTVFVVVYVLSLSYSSRLPLSLFLSQCNYCHIHSHYCMYSVLVVILPFSSRLLPVFWSGCNTCHVHPGDCLCSGLGIITAVPILWSGLGVITLMFIQVTYCLCSGQGSITAMFIQITVCVVV